MKLKNGFIIISSNDHELILYDQSFKNGKPIQIGKKDTNTYS